MKPYNDNLTSEQRKEMKSWPSWRFENAKYVTLLDNSKILIQKSHSLEDCRLEERYGLEISEWLSKRFNKLLKSDSFGFEDSFRVFELEKEDDQYKLFLLNCCCGFASHIVKWKDGRKFIIGFNYGH